MTAFILQEELAKEFERITKHMALKNPSGKTASLTAYNQELPILNHNHNPSLEDEEEEPDDPFPYAIVKIISGKHKDTSSHQEVTTRILLGIWDDSQSNQGHKSILNIIQRFQERFRKNPILSCFFVMNESIEWVLEEEALPPYYFGAIEVSWRTASIQREDKYA